MSQDDKPNQELPNSIVTVVQEDDGSLKTNSSMEANVIEKKRGSLNKKKREKGDPQIATNFGIHSIQIDSWKWGIVHYPGDMQFRCYFLRKEFVCEIMHHGIKVKYQWDDLQLISFNEERRELQIEIKKKPRVSFIHILSTAYPPLWKTLSVEITNVFASESKIHVLTFSPDVYIELYGRFRAVAQVNSGLKNLIRSGEKNTDLLAPNQIPLTLPQTSDVQPSPSSYQRPNQVQAQAESINTNGQNHGKLKSGVKTEQQKAELQRPCQAQIPYATSQKPYRPFTFLNQIPYATSQKPLTLPQTSDVQPSEIKTREELQRPYQAQAESINTDLTLSHNPAAYGQEGAICADENGSPDSPPMNGSPTAALSPDGNGNLIKFL